MKRKKISVDLLARMPDRVIEYVNKNGYEVVVYGVKGPVALLKPYSKTAGGRSLPGFQMPLLEDETIDLRKVTPSIDTGFLYDEKQPENKRHKVQKNWRKRFRLFSYQSSKKLARFGIVLPFLARF